MMGTIDWVEDDLPVRECTSDECRDAFDRWAARYDEAVARAEDYYERYEEVLEAIVEVGEINDGSQVLDIGTGTGNLASKCLARGARVLGVDPSRGMLAEAREKLGGRSSLTLMHIEEPFLHMPAHDGAFDAVVSSYAFHHVPRGRQADAVREMLRVTRPGGTIAVGDILFESEDAEREALRRFEWLEAEEFGHIDNLRCALGEAGAALEARRFTPVAWVIWAVRPAQ